MPEYEIETPPQPSVTCSFCLQKNASTAIYKVAVRYSTGQVDRVRVLALCPFCLTDLVDVANAVGRATTRSAAGASTPTA